MAKNDVNADLVRKLAELIDETGLNEIEYDAGTWRIRVAKGGGQVIAAAPAAGPAPGATPNSAPGVGTGAADAASHPGAVTSPMVGTIYMSREPGAPAFVSAGDTVKAGDTLLLVEAMKTFNEIKAPKAGTITEILVADKQPVEFGDVLLVIE